MKTPRAKLLCTLILVGTSLCLTAPAAFALQDNPLSSLPGAEQWQPYLTQSPVELSALAKDPLAVLKSLFQNSLWDVLQQTLRGSTDALLFLLLAALLSFLTSEATNGALLDLIAAGGCGVLLWGKLFTLAEHLCTQMEEWRRFLMGFLPVYAGVLTMGGENAAGGAASGFFLTVLCFLAQCLAAFVKPLLQCYLALSMACCISTDHGLDVFCKGMGSLLQQVLRGAGKLLALLLGLQRVTALQLDRSALRAGRLLTGSIPIIGQALSDASETILAGVQLLKSGLGFAAIAFLAAEFLPLYLGMLIQWGLLQGSSLLCGLTGDSRCKALLDCFAEAVRCMAAATALFFWLFVMGTVLLFVAGGG